ncbi:DNA repair protein [Mammaliicoccus sciuri]|uniref:Y-family DNA polymerase n=1 Tax=Mammaliicoccus sciuri TaxID=1296 RepID=UPI0028845716|nr:DNA repair protein [Mammaliicoccus sciuri]MDT0702836.1 DNA repair protein [Mammaliicoccus sciuri]
MYDYSYCLNQDILCVDLKSFFASVSCIEKGLNPLTTKLAVVADTKRKGSVVLAATPPLKEIGIKTGSRLFEIPQRKDIYVINPSMKNYIQLSTQISKIALDYVAPEDFHQYSIDEFFMDVSESYHLFAHSPFSLAMQLQERIFNYTQIRSTIGIGSNLLLAKLSMDIDAKYTSLGISEWRYEDVPSKVWAIQPLRDMWGINRRTETKLNKKGIFTIGHLANYPVEYLKRDFGVIGVDLHLHANGIDESVIRKPHRIYDKSLGKSQILMRDYSMNELKTVLNEQVDEVYFRSRKLNLYPTRISVSVGYADVGGVRKQFTNKTGFMNTYVITQLLWDYLSQRLEPDRLYRTMAISFGKFIPNQIKQLSLFDDPYQIKTETLENHLDFIRMKYGKDVVMRGSSLLNSGTLLERKDLIAGHKA